VLGSDVYIFVVEEVFNESQGGFCFIDANFDFCIFVEFCGCI
jgi:hypothetical protein